MFKGRVLFKHFDQVFQRNLLQLNRTWCCVLHLNTFFKTHDHLWRKKNILVQRLDEVCVVNFVQEEIQSPGKLERKKTIWSFSMWPRISLRRFWEKVYTRQKSQSRICHLMFSFELVGVDSLYCKFSCSRNKLRSKATIKRWHLFWEISVE